MLAIIHSQISEALPHDGACRVKKHGSHSKTSYVPDNKMKTESQHSSDDTHQRSSEESYVTSPGGARHDPSPNIDKTDPNSYMSPRDDSQVNESENTPRNVIQPGTHSTGALVPQPPPVQAHNGTKSSPPVQAHNGTKSSPPVQAHNGTESSPPAQAHNGTVLSPKYKGTGTTWGGNWKGGNCDFKDWDPPAGFPEVAMAGNLWNSASLCGSCVEVTGPTGLKKVAIVGDSCFSCSNDGLDMDPVMWNAVTGNASPSALPITWGIVPCGFPTPLKIINKEGVSKYFMSMQIAGANQPVHSVEISTDGGQSWTKTNRQSSDNFFQLSNPPKDAATVAVKVTCASGKKVFANSVDYSRPGIAASTENC